MIEVFVFGVFVAYVKLGDLVTITLDVGVYALLALTVVIIWADSSLTGKLCGSGLAGQFPMVAVRSRRCAMPAQ